MDTLDFLSHDPSLLVLYILLHFSSAVFWNILQQDSVSFHLKPRGSFLLQEYAALSDACKIFGLVLFGLVLWHINHYWLSNAESTNLYKLDL